MWHLPHDRVVDEVFVSRESGVWTEVFDDGVVYRLRRLMTEWWMRGLMTE